MNTEKRKSPTRRKIAGLFHSAYTAWIVLLIGFVVTGAAWYTSSEFVNKNAELRFEARTKEISKAIRARMAEYEQVLWGGIALFRASREVDRQEFRIYVDALRLQENWPGIQGMGFSIPLTPEQKLDHVLSIRAEGFPTFDIKPEGERDAYSSIIFLEPFDWRNRRAFGYDMWSNEMRREAMARARDTGEASTSGIITLVQETQTDVQRGFLTYLPLYRIGMPTKTIEERRAAFVGWVYSPFRMGDLMKGILGEGETNVEYEIFDGTILTKEALLYDSNDVFHAEDADNADVWTRTRTLNLQGRTWTIVYTAGSNQLTNAESAQPTMVAAAGLVVDLLLFYIISSIAIMQRRAEKLATDMTEDARGARSELEEKLVELEQSNNDLRKFAYVASHDLKAPMRAVHQLAAWIEEELESIDGLENTDVKKYLSQMKGRADRMQKLLDSLLTYATVGENQQEISSFETDKCIRDVIEFISPPDDVQIDLTGDMPRINGEKALFEQVMSNLISNAIKHSGSGPCRIEISARPLGAFYEFAVKDDGPGIPTKHHERIFELFQTLKRRDEVEGSGMGLAIVKKLIERRGGAITVESDPDVRPGTTFKFTWKSNIAV